MSESNNSHFWATLVRMKRRSHYNFYSLTMLISAILTFFLIGNSNGFPLSRSTKMILQQRLEGSSNNNNKYRSTPPPPWIISTTSIATTTCGTANRCYLSTLHTSSSSASEIDSTASESLASNTAGEDPSLQVSLEEFLSNAELAAAKTLEASSFLDDEDEEDDNYNFWMEEEGSYYDEQPQQQPLYLRDEEEILTEREDRLYSNASNRQRAVVETCILVGVDDISEERKQQQQKHSRGGAIFTMEESMKEMRELIKTAGMELVGEITQRLQEPNPRTYVGTGKLLETQEMAKLKDACTIVFDAELTPGQQKSLENALNKNILQNDFLGSDGVSHTTLCFMQL